MLDQHCVNSQFWRRVTFFIVHSIYLSNYVDFVFVKGNFLLHNNKMN